MSVNYIGPQSNLSCEDTPIICFFKTGPKPSGSLRFVTDNVVEYSDIQDLSAKLQTKLDQPGA